MGDVMEFIKNVLIIVGIFVFLALGVFLLLHSGDAKKKMSGSIVETRNQIEEINQTMDETIEQLESINPTLEKAMKTVDKFNKEFLTKK